MSRKKQKYSPPRGMRDLLPDAMRQRQFITDTLRQIFETHGFDALETPAMEKAETLLGKYGPEAERLIYRAGHGRDNDLALRYDLTVPLARVVTSSSDLPRPFRRYQISPVWRGERPQHGRYREFVQADVDIVGSDSMMADAEIIAIVVRGLSRLGFGKTLIKINNRKLLAGIGKYAGVPEFVLPGLFRAIDKMDKIGLEGVRQELRAVGLPGELINRQKQAVERWWRGSADRETIGESLEGALAAEEDPRFRSSAIPAFLDSLEQTFPAGDPPADRRLAELRNQLIAESVGLMRTICPESERIPGAAIDGLLTLLSMQGDNDALIDQMAELLEDDAARIGLDELREVLGLLDALKVDPSSLQIDFSMVRGLDYYTGTIFECIVQEPAIGSILGGGRYDNLTALFGKPVPAVGTSFGVDRIQVALDENNLFPESIQRSRTAVLVVAFDESCMPAAIGLVSDLRAAGVPSQLSYSLGKIGQQIRSALSQGIGRIAILGPDELEEGVFVLKDLAANAQTKIDMDSAGASVRALLDSDA